MSISTTVTKLQEVTLRIVSPVLGECDGATSDMKSGANSADVDSNCGYWTVQLMQAGKVLTITTYSSQNDNTIYKSMHIVPHHQPENAIAISTTLKYGYSAIGKHSIRRRCRPALN